MVGKGWEKRVEQGLVPRDLVFPASQLIPNMVKEGRLGRKSGRGFYDVRLARAGGLTAVLEREEQAALVSELHADLQKRIWGLSALSRSLASACRVRF